MSKNLEQIILSNLIYNEEFCRKVLPYIKEEYFTLESEKQIYRQIASFIVKYNKIPNTSVLAVEIDDTRLNEMVHKDTKELLSNFTPDDRQEIDWLMDATEDFCKEAAAYNAAQEMIAIIDGVDEGKREKGAILDIFSKALSVSFDSSIGHDFIENAEERYEFYHATESKIPFRLNIFNRITRGGLSNKTLSIILAGTAVGKSLAMCSFAADNLLDGKNVLYITMEMQEKRIAERIDANLLNVQMDDLENLSKEEYTKKIDKLKFSTSGKLIIKEYPTSTAGAGHFRFLINELKLKKQFKPDIIYIDYLNICNSTRIKQNGAVNSYTYIKAIAEELRGLAVEQDVPIVSATQTNREGYSNSDVDLTNTSESFGLPATADFMFALINSEELEGMNCLMVKQLKNRYNDVGYYRRFMIGCEKPKMRFYDIDNPTEGILQDTDMSDKPKKDFSALK